LGGKRGVCGIIVEERKKKKKGCLRPWKVKVKKKGGIPMGIYLREGGFVKPLGPGGREGGGEVEGRAANSTTRDLTIPRREKEKGERFNVGEKKEEKGRCYLFAEPGR